MRTTLVSIFITLGLIGTPYHMALAQQEALPPDSFLVPHEILQEFYSDGYPYNELRGKVSDRHGADYSSAAIKIESQFGDVPGQIDMSDTRHRFRLHGVDSGGPKTHYQGVGILRDTTVSAGGVNQRYRRAVLSYNYGPGLLVSAGRIDGDIEDGVTAWDTNKLVRFQDEKSFLDIINEPNMGNHSHPGGLQSHGDMIAIAMEQPQSGTQAAVYFIKVDGIIPRFVTSLQLGTGGAPQGLELNAAAASGFLKLDNGYLVAVSGSGNGKTGIWFYKTSDNEITATTEWMYIDFWTPDRMSQGVCNIDDGKHSTDCYVGAGGGLSLLTNDNGAIYLMATTGTFETARKDDEYAQLYRISIKRSDQPTRTDMNAVWSGKKRLGLMAWRKYSMRWAGAAQTTESGRVFLLNTERGQRKAGSRGASDGILRISK